MQLARPASTAPRAPPARVSLRIQTRADAMLRRPNAIPACLCFAAQRVCLGPSAPRRRAPASPARATASAPPTRRPACATPATLAAALAPRSPALVRAHEDPGVGWGRPILTCPLAFAPRFASPGCTAGTYSSTTGATSCMACPTGSVSGAGATTCSCSPGFSTSGVGSSLTCTGTRPPSTAGSGFGHGGRAANVSCTLRLCETQRALRVPTASSAPPASVRCYNFRIRKRARPSLTSALFPALFPQLAMLARTALGKPASARAARRPAPARAARRPALATPASRPPAPAPASPAPVRRSHCGAVVRS